MVRHRGAMLERIRAGKPIDYCPVIDFHTHLGKAASWYYMPDHEPERVIAYMAAYGIDHLVTFALSVASDVETGNEYQYEAAARFPARISALSQLHAGFPQDWDPILRNGLRNGSRGIKLISHYQGAQAEANIDWSPALEFASDKNWVVLNHSWGNERLAWYAREFPTVTFIIGHSDGSTGALCGRYDNVYQCTCASFVVCYCASVEELYRSHPLEKILYGSDSLDLDFGTAIGEIAYADLPEAAKERILGGNALSLMAKLGWRIDGLS